MSHSPTLEKRAFLWVFLAFLLLGLYVIYPFFNTLLVSVVFAVLFYPLHKLFLKWTHRPGLASVFSVLAVMFLLIIPVAVLLTMFSAQLAGFLQNFPKTISDGGVSGLLSHWESYVQPIVQKIEGFFGIQFNLGSLIWEGFQKLGQSLAQYSPAVLATAGSFFLDLFIMLIVLFYLFRDGANLFEKFIIISPVKDQYEIKLASEIKETIYGVFYGSFLTGLIQAIFATIGFAIARIPGALLWGVITFFVSFIPILGTATVIVPMILYLFIKGNIGYAIFLAIYGGIVIGSSDNILKPMLIRSNMHQAILFLSLFGGMAVFGAVGLLLGPIIMAILTAILTIYEEDYLREAPATTTNP